MALPLADTTGEEAPGILQRVHESEKDSELLQAGASLRADSLYWMSWCFYAPVRLKYSLIPSVMQMASVF